MRIKILRFCAVYSWTLALLLLVTSAPSFAQQQPDAHAQEQAATEPAAEVARASTEEAEQTGAQLEAFQKRMEQLEARDAEKEKRITELEARDAEKEQTIAELEIQAQQSLADDFESEAQERFSLYGFFDLELKKWIYPKKSSTAVYLPPKLFFSIVHFNLYMKSVLTDTLSVLGELRFSFLPHGSDESYEIQGLPPEGMPSQGIFGNQFTRVDNTVTDPTTTLMFRPGGVTIERIHLTYSPADWFNIIAGRYLTPFGIWNVDHGSPVVLCSGWPYLFIREMVPLAQTGVQVYGRMFPSDRLFFDYAVTLSNGRGLLESYLDLDNNKAAGLRLKLSYHGDDFTVAGGGYGYLGKYTDDKKVLHVAGLSARASEDLPLLAESVPTWVSDEYSVATDLLLEAFGVRLQVEYAFKYTDVLVSPLMASESALFQGATPLEQLFAPSAVGHDVYVLLGYELPLKEWLDPVVITPYFLYEYGKVSDVYMWIDHIRWIGGLNVRTSPFVTLKLEGLVNEPMSDILGGDIYAVSGQMAVSF